MASRGRRAVIKRHKEAVLRLVLRLEARPEELLFEAVERAVPLAVSRVFKTRDIRPPGDIDGYLTIAVYDSLLLALEDMGVTLAMGVTHAS